MKKQLGILLASVGLACSSGASVLLNETFTYPDGPIVGAAGSPWTSHSGTTTADVSGNQLKVTTARSQDINAPLSGAPYPVAGAAVLYSSFKVTFTALPTTLGGYFAHFKDSTTSGFRDRIYSTISGAAVGSFRLGIANATNNTTGAVIVPQDLALDTTYTIVTRYEVGTAASTTMWIDPASESDPGTTATDAHAANPPLDITSYAFREASDIGTMLIDDLKVGTSFADVTGNNPALNPPTITAIASQAITAGASTGPIPFTISDGETPAASLTLSGASTNETLIPVANIAFGGSASNRTVTVTGAPGQEGVSAITITVKDGDNNTSARTFLVTVGAPTITAIPEQILDTNVVAAPIPFTIADAETAPASLTVTVNSSNTELLPNANIALGGSGAARTLTLSPVTGLIGNSTVTVTVSDGTLSALTRFIVTVRPKLGVIFSDDFSSYTEGNTLPDATTWLGHSGTTGALVSGGRVYVSGTNDADFNVELRPIPYLTLSTTNGAVLYASFTLSCADLPTNNTYFAHFKDIGTSNFRAKVFGLTNDAAMGKFRLAVANSVSTATVTLPVDLTPGTDYTVVVRYNVPAGTSKLWVNPNSETDAGVAAPDSSATLNVDSFALRQSTGMGTYALDNLKIGSHFTDVVNVVAQPSVTAVTAVAGSLRIDFTAGAADTAEQFTLVGSTDVTAAPAAYTPVAGASIVALGGGSFRATAPIGSGAQFFLIKR